MRVLRHNNIYTYTHIIILIKWKIYSGIENYLVWSRNGIKGLTSIDQKGGVRGDLCFIWCMGRTGKRALINPCRLRWPAKAGEVVDLSRVQKGRVAA